MSRVRGIQIYLKPSIEEDDVFLELWDQCRMKARPQDVFRRMLRAGLKVMVENGEIPESIVDELHLEERLFPRRARIAPTAVRAIADTRRVERYPDDHPAVGDRAPARLLPGIEDGQGAPFTLRGQAAEDWGREVAPAPRNDHRPTADRSPTSVAPPAPIRQEAVEAAPQPAPGPSPIVQPTPFAAPEQATPRPGAEPSTSLGDGTPKRRLRPLM